MSETFGVMNLYLNIVSASGAGNLLWLLLFFGVVDLVLLAGVLVLRLTHLLFLRGKDFDLPQVRDERPVYTKSRESLGAMERQNGRR